MPEEIIGIDLGTSNCAMAYIADEEVRDFPILQTRRPGEQARLPILPSAIYIPGEHELPDQTSDIVGEFARWQGAKVPSRLVVSAKSWLSHSGVDRSAPILPWGAPAEVRKISPVDASARLLRHMVESWNSEHPAAPLENQEVVITVPASFDEVARALTVNAAKQAGLTRFTLLEEPQAAFYDFVSRQRDRLAGALQDVHLVLVVDVGGGTSDFTLVQVGEDQAMRRIAVGDHLMLGGDNMDAAIARRAEERMMSEGRKLSASQWTQLVQACRQAKESLLGDNPPETYHLSIAGESSQLIGSAISTELYRDEVRQIVLDGFLPYSAPHEMPRRTSRVALQDLGLPYAQDPAISRQLASFLKAHSSAGTPDSILLNGGVFNSRQIADRLVEVLNGWRNGSPPIRLLAHDSLELAVARGAAYYGLARRGTGRRIAGGTAHAFYVGLESRREAKALCIIPRGHEEGRTVDIARTFNLTLGKPVRFPLFTSTSDRVTASGEILAVEEDLHPLPPIHTILKSREDLTGVVPVHLRAALTEIGTLELWCVSDSGDEQWRLEFELRGTPASAAATTIESMPARFSEARTSIEHIFGGKPTPGTPITTNVKQLWRGLEQTLGPRDQWRATVLRELWSALFAGAARRRRSVDHERIWFQLTGFTLRPGFGYPLDEWRAAQTATLFEQGVAGHKEKPVWTEFWIMWRRIAGGLNETAQQEIWRYLRPHLERRLTGSTGSRIKGVQPEGHDEMIRLAASLEHLEVADKTLLGDWIAGRASPPGLWTWSVGRIGARVPLYGSGHKTVEPAKAAEWLELLFDAQSKNVDGALFAIVQLARLSGDRSRDLDDAVRTRALDVLREAGAPASWQRLLVEVVSMEAADQIRAFGDTLPIGLAA